MLCRKKESPPIFVPPCLLLFHPIFHRRRRMFIFSQYSRTLEKSYLVEGASVSECVRAANSECARERKNLR
jgi:hypothetical protein